MKKSSTKRKDTSTQPKSAAPDLPKDLKDLWGAVEACATACNVLKHGMYAPDWLKAVAATHAFMYKLYENAMEAASAHPKAALIPELKSYKDKPKKSEVQSGEEEQTVQ